jgi:hypothetical protein
VTPIAALHGVEPGRARLWCDETVLAVREGAAVERREPPATHGVEGALFLTSRRLLLEGRAADIEIDLGEICETDVVGDRLVLTLASGRHLWLDCGLPRLLRVQLAAARAGGRRG